MSLEKNFQHNTSETNCTLSLFAYCELMGFKRKGKNQSNITLFYPDIFQKKQIYTL